MLPLIYLDARRLLALLPVIGVMLAFGMVPVLLQRPQGGTTGIAFVAMSAMVLISRLFPFDSSGSRINVLVGTLPVTRRQVIGSRYTLALLIVAVTGVLIAVLLPSIDLTDRLGITALFTVIPLISVAVTGPLSSRGGLGPVGPALPLLCFGVLMLAAVLMPESWQQVLVGFILQAPAASAGIGIVGVGAVLVVSLWLSVRWFERRDL